MSNDPLKMTDEKCECGFPVLCNSRECRCGECGRKFPKAPAVVVGPVQPKTFEVVLYDDGTSAVSEFDRGTPENESQQTYVGRSFHDVERTAEILTVLTGKRPDWLA